MPVSKSQLKAQAKYNKTHTKAISIRFNKKTDKDILEKLDSVENKQGYIKGLIRDDIHSGETALQGEAKLPE